MLIKRLLKKAPGPVRMDNLSRAACLACLTGATYTAGWLTMSNTSRVDIRLRSSLVKGHESEKEPRSSLLRPF